MPETMPNGPMTSPDAGAKSGGAKSKLFFALMLAGTVVAAGGYAVMSKNGGGESSAPFAPQTATGSPESSKKPYAGEKAPDASPGKITVTTKNSPKATSGTAQAGTKVNAPPVTAISGHKSVAASAGKVKVAKADTGKSTRRVESSAVEKASAKAVETKTSERPRVAQAAQVQRVAAGWPEYRGPKRDGISQEKGWFGDGEPEMVWKTNIGAGFASVVIANGRAYAMGNNNNQDTVYCFDAATGQGVWRYSYACDIMDKQHEGGPSATPTVDGDTVYTYSKMGQLHALNATNGRVIWRKDVPREMGGQIPNWGVSSTPAVYGDALYVMTGARNACVTAFDKKTGDVLWQSDNSAPAYAALQVFEWKGAPYVAAFDADGVKFLDAKNGKVLWSYGWKTNYDVNAAIPVIADDKVFISSGYGTGCAMLQSTAQNPLLWQNRDMKNHFNASVLVNGYIYGFDESELACLDARTGRKMWSQGRLGKGSLIASDGKLIILSERGELVIADANPQGFKELSRTQILGGKCWSAPSLANGRIYARNADGDLVCAKF